jgi:hypothetical protein
MPQCRVALAILAAAAFPRVAPAYPSGPGVEENLTLTCDGQTVVTNGCQGVPRHFINSGGTPFSRGCRQELWRAAQLLRAGARGGRKRRRAFVGSPSRETESRGTGGTGAGVSSKDRAKYRE